MKELKAPLKNVFFLENYVTLEGAVYHNVLYYINSSPLRYQVKLYVNYFE